MWCWEKTKKFLRTGYRLFHGNFFTFMAVPRYTGKTVSGEMTREALTPFPFYMLLCSIIIDPSAVKIGL